MGERRLTPGAATAAAMLMFACASRDDDARRPAPAPRPVAVTAEQTGTALAAVAPSEPVAAPPPDVPDAPQVDDFRQRVVAAMTSALGAPPKTRQDAINAAYRHVGWEDGEQPSDHDNHDAYHQACRWGFHLGEFAKAGRQGAFDPNELASAPLDEHAHRAWTGHGRGHRAPSPALSERDRAAPVSAASPLPAERTVDGSGDERARRIENLTLRLEQLARTTNDLNDELSQLERDAKARDLPEWRMKALRQRADSVRELIRYAEASALKLEQSLNEAREE